MPSAISHPAVPLMLGLALGFGIVPGRLLLAGMAAAVLPDLDALAFRLGIPYEHPLGHRGASHSLLFALLMGLAAAAAARRLRCRPWMAFVFVAFAGLSHGLLDMLTNGGHGIALLWPFSVERFWFPLRPIEASPISMRRFFTGSGVVVLWSEARWVWLPSLLVGVAVFIARRRAQARRRRQPPSGMGR